MNSNTLNIIASHIATGITKYNLNYTESFLAVSVGLQRNGNTTLLNITGTQDGLLITAVSSIIDYSIDQDVTLVENDANVGVESEDINDDDSGIENEIV